MSELDVHDKAYKFKDLKVIKEFFGDTFKPWPGTHKNVHYWILLENGIAVGLNENPARGLSFPFIKIAGI